ncbi:hypothetical protein BGZ72_008770, partial [Mortierella alpina]
THDDLWLPQTTPDGQVFYFNTRTGDSSWSIPAPANHREGATEDEEAARDQSHPSDSDADSSVQQNDSIENNSDWTSNAPVADSAPASKGRVNLNIRTSGTVHELTDTESQGWSTRPSSWQTSAIPLRVLSSQILVTAQEQQGVINMEGRREGLDYGLELGAGPMPEGAKIA